MHLLKIMRDEKFDNGDIGHNAQLSFKIKWNPKIQHLLQQLLLMQKMLVQ